MQESIFVPPCFYVFFASVLVPAVCACGTLVDLGPEKHLSVDGDAGTGDDAGSPGSIRSVQAVVDLDVGASHACAVVRFSPGDADNGSLRCWGNNDRGQLGADPAVVPSSAKPLTVPHLTQAVTTSVGVSSSCALTSDRFLECWGELPAESNGGIHRQDATSPFEPALVGFRSTALVNVEQVALSAGGGCALADGIAVDDGTLVCWGKDDFAPATSIDGGVAHVDGGGITRGEIFTGVATGSYHVCAMVTRSGATYPECWGHDDFGQVGLPAFAGESAPHEVPLPHVTQVAAGGDTSCALADDDSPAGASVYCWGKNDRGQAGAPPASDRVTVPVRVPIPTAWRPVFVTVGLLHACALLADETAWCWGDDTAGQLGRPEGPGTMSDVPLHLRRANGSSGAVTLGGVHRIAAGGRTTCAILQGDPRAWCWGANDVGQAGQPSGVAVAPVAPVAW